MQQMRGVIHESGGQGVLRGDGQHAPPSVFPSEPGGFAQPWGGLLTPMFSQLLDEPDGLRAPTAADLAGQDHEPAARRMQEFRVPAAFPRLGILDGDAVLYRGTRFRFPGGGERGDQGDIAREGDAASHEGEVLGDDLDLATVALRDWGFQFHIGQLLPFQDLCASFLQHADEHLLHGFTAAVEEAGKRACSGVVAEEIVWLATMPAVASHRRLGEL